jgi:hypothetical protein
MKNVAFLMLAAYMLATAGCGSLDADVKPTPTGYQQYFECKVNGLLWKPDTPSIIMILPPVSAAYSPYYGFRVSTLNRAKNDGVGFHTPPGVFTPTPSQPIGIINKLGYYPLMLADYNGGKFDSTKAYYLKMTRIDSAFNTSKEKRPLFEGEFAFTSVSGRDTTIVTDGKFGLLLGDF